MAGEDAFDAVKRELQEELDLKLDCARPLIKVSYQYPEKKVILNVWKIEDWHGEIRACEGQIIRWVAHKDLVNYSFPAANKPIVSAICLPSLYLISPDLLVYESYGLDRLERFLDSGLTLFQLKCTDTDHSEYSRLVYQLKELFGRHNASLILNAEPSLAKKYAADGVHLSSRRLLNLTERPLDHSFYVGASCHNSAELQHAEKIDVDFVTFSPVNQTASHENSKPIGWSKFKASIENANLPVFALGGLNGSDVYRAWNSGAQGLAMINGVWSATDPDKVIRDCH